jgi:hypothetical protein
LEFAIWNSPSSLSGGGAGGFGMNDRAFPSNSQAARSQCCA